MLTMNFQEDSRRKAILSNIAVVRPSDIIFLLRRLVKLPQESLQTFLKNRELQFLRGVLEVAKRENEGNEEVVGLTLEVLTQMKMSKNQVEGSGLMKQLVTIARNFGRNPLISLRLRTFLISLQSSRQRSRQRAQTKTLRWANSIQNVRYFSKQETVSGESPCQESVDADLTQLNYYSLNKPCFPPRPLTSSCQSQHIRPQLVAEDPDNAKEPAFLPVNVGRCPKPKVIPFCEFKQLQQDFLIVEQDEGKSRIGLRSILRKN